jgi:hypothetical protein
MWTEQSLAYLGIRIRAQLLRDLFGRLNTMLGTHCGCYPVIGTARYDVAKLIELCKELNCVYQAQCFLATAILVRTVLDHVPPIFRYKSFTDVANSYSGGSKSFRQSMVSLENSSRKIAGAH